MKYGILCFKLLIDFFEHKKPWGLLETHIFLEETQNTLGERYFFGGTQKALGNAIFLGGTQKALGGTAFPRVPPTLITVYIGLFPSK